MTRRENRACQLLFVRLAVCCLLIGGEVFVMPVEAASFEGAFGSFGSSLVLVEVTSLLDSDDDGLSDVVERALGTDPLFGDSDGDGPGDYWEVVNGLDPLDPFDVTLDSDADGLSDFAEWQLGTLIYDVDSDHDGFWDNVERDRGTDPSTGASRPIPTSYGDVNADGGVDSSDIQLVINGALGLATPVPVDVDGFGSVDAMDIQQVINAALGQA